MRESTEGTKRKATTDLTSTRQLKTTRTDRRKDHADVITITSDDDSDAEYFSLGESEDDAPQTTTSRRVRAETNWSISQTSLKTSQNKTNCPELYMFTSTEESTLQNSSPNETEAQHLETSSGPHDSDSEEDFTQVARALPRNLSSTGSTSSTSLAFPLPKDTRGALAAVEVKKPDAEKISPKSTARIGETSSDASNLATERDPALQTTANLESAALDNSLFIPENSSAPSKPVAADLANAKPAPRFSAGTLKDPHMPTSRTQSSQSTKLREFLEQRKLEQRKQLLADPKKALKEAQEKAAKHADAVRSEETARQADTPRPLSTPDNTQSAIANTVHASSKSRVPQGIIKPSTSALTPHSLDRSKAAGFSASTEIRHMTPEVVAPTVDAATGANMAAEVDVVSEIEMATDVDVAPEVNVTPDVDMALEVDVAPKVNVAFPQIQRPSMPTMSFGEATKILSKDTNEKATDPILATPKLTHSNARSFSSRLYREVTESNRANAKVNETRASDQSMASEDEEEGIAQGQDQEEDGDEDENDEDDEDDQAQKKENGKEISTKPRTPTANTNSTALAGSLPQEYQASTEAVASLKAQLGPELARRIPHSVLLIIALTASGVSVREIAARLEIMYGDKRSERSIKDRVTYWRGKVPVVEEFLSKKNSAGEGAVPSQVDLTTQAGSQTRSAPTSRPTTGGKTLAPVQPRPTTGGKTLPPSMHRQLQEDLDEDRVALLKDSGEGGDDTILGIDTDDEEVSMLEASPEAPEDAIHHVYQVNRRQSVSGDSETMENYVCGDDYESLYEANQAASLELHSERGTIGILPTPDILVTTAVRLDRDGMLQGERSFGETKIEVFVTRLMRSYNQGIMPQSKAGWMPKRIWQIEATITKGLEPAITTILPTPYEVYSILDFANRAASAQYLALRRQYIPGFSAQTMDNYERGVKEKEELEELLKEMEVEEIAFDGEFRGEEGVGGGKGSKKGKEKEVEGGVEVKVRVRVVEGRLHGPRNI